MADLLTTRVVLVPTGTIKKTTFPLIAGGKATEGCIVGYDTGAYGSIKGTGLTAATFVPIGWALQTIDNSANGANVACGVELQEEANISYWDSVTGAGAITIANLFQSVYVLDNHTLTTTAGGSIAGRVFSISPGGYPGAVGIRMTRPV
jgi:hypothetical protein